jgi:hypothetical protein
MTTSWAYAVRWNWISAAESNVGGALLAGIGMLMGPWLLVSACRGQWFARAPNERVVAIAAIGVVCVTLIDWIYRLTTGS